MSGDVQPRKRKDKKRKKDELGVEEPRGTAAVLGEGDVFMHSQNEHGTGGHWCAKIIFFSLLAILITLIGLIILENRGLTELEANAVETRYSGVLQGWLEDSPDDDHHDEHTLDLKHQSDEDFATGDQDSDVEIEKIEKEYSDEESNETPIQLPVAPIKKDFNKNVEKSSENHSEEEDDDDTEFLSPEDIAELPIVEPITAPRGKPFIELEDETSTEKPPNTLAEEEQYEKQQAELNRQKEQASHMWLKVVVGCALLVATHGVVRRATASRGSYSHKYNAHVQATTLPSM